MLFDGHIPADYSYAYFNPIFEHDLGFVTQGWLLYETRVLTDGNAPPISQLQTLTSLTASSPLTSPNTSFLNPGAQGTPIISGDSILASQAAGDINAALQQVGLLRSVSGGPLIQDTTTAASLYFKVTLYYERDTGLLATP